MLSDEELNRMIGPILQKWLSSSGLERFTVEQGEDHDGDPSIFIVAHFRRAQQQVDATALLNSIGEIREKLRKRGDPRLPYVRYAVSETPHEVAI